MNKVGWKFGEITSSRVQEVVESVDSLRPILFPHFILKGQEGLFFENTWTVFLYD